MCFAWLYSSPGCLWHIRGSPQLSRVLLKHLCRLCGCSSASGIHSHTPPAAAYFYAFVNFWPGGIHEEDVKQSAVLDQCQSQDGFTWCLAHGWSGLEVCASACQACSMKTKVLFRNSTRWDGNKETFFFFLDCKPEPDYIYIYHGRCHVSCDW